MDLQDDATIFGLSLALVGFLVEFSSIWCTVQTRRLVAHPLAGNLPQHILLQSSVVLCGLLHFWVNYSMFSADTTKDG